MGDALSRVLAECPGDGLGDFAGFLGELHDAQQLLGLRRQQMMSYLWRMSARRLSGSGGARVKPVHALATFPDLLAALSKPAVEEGSGGRQREPGDRRRCI